MGRGHASRRQPCAHHHQICRKLRYKLVGARAQFLLQARWQGQSPMAHKAWRSLTPERGSSYAPQLRRAVQRIERKM